MRDVQALLRFWDEFLNAFEPVMLANGRLGRAQLRCSVDLLLRKESHGNVSATAALDQLETMMADERCRSIIREERSAGVRRAA